MQKIIYTIPGLGLDNRIFSRLDIVADGIVPIDWIEPEYKENIDHYAARMADVIKNPSEAVLLGHSFGGMMALKIAALLDIPLTIIVSSIKNKQELPGIFQILKWIPLYKIYSDKTRDKTLPYWSYFFGIEGKDDQELFKSMLRRNSNKYREWAIEQVVRFEHDDSLSNILHIHGDRDRIFPADKLKHFIQVKGGDHFMIWKKPEEISDIINSCLQPALIDTN